MGFQHILVEREEGLALTTEDHQEAVRAFFEKREPVYKGQ